MEMEQAQVEKARVQEEVWAEMEAGAGWVATALDQALEDIVYAQVARQRSNTNQGCPAILQIAPNADAGW